MNQDGYAIIEKNFPDDFANPMESSSCLAKLMRS